MSQMSTEVQSKLKETFASLEAMYKATPTDQAELVYTLRGVIRVLSKLMEMIRGARASIMLVTPAETLEESGTLLEELGKAASRGVNLCHDRRGEPQRSPGKG